MISPPHAPILRAGWSFTSASISRTVARVTGCFRSGASSARGARTKRRCAIRGCGISSSSVFMTKFPNSRMSMSMVRGPFGRSRRRPSSFSMRWISCSSCRGNSAVSASATRFRNHGWRSTSCGAVSHIDDTRTMLTPRCRSRLKAPWRIAGRPPRLEPSERYAVCTASEEQVLRGAAPPRRMQAEILEGALGSHTAARRTVDEAELDQVWLVDFFNGGRLLVDRRRDGVDAYGPAAVFLQQRGHDLLVDFVEAEAVDFEHVQRGDGHLPIDVPVGTDLGVIADPTQQPVGDARSAPAAARDLGRALRVDGHVQQARGAEHDAGQLRLVVMIQPQHQAKAAPQRRADEALPGGSADAGEARQ